MTAATTRSFWERLSARPEPILWGIALAAVIILGGVAVLYKTVKADQNPLILRLTPSFFFWLGMIYTALLLLMAAVYSLSKTPTARTTLLGGILPIGVPWFGALGAVTISLEGVFLWNNQWDRKYNYWHIGRPLFGAVLGIVAFFLFVVIVTASGSTPKFLDDPAAPGKDYIIFYVVAFLVGYREETFRDLIKRATDLILKPGTTPSAAAPGVTFKVGDAAPSEITCADAAVNATTEVTVGIHNSGSAPLTDPAVALASTSAKTFAVKDDLVTGHGDLAAGQARTITIAFTPIVAGTHAATLTVSATNLPAPKTIKVTGKTA